MDANIRHLSEYLDSQHWDFFMTGTTGYSLSLPSARRLAERYFNMMPASSKLFWVAERFECKDGYHIHGLLDLKGSDLSHDPSRTGILSQWWQLATGNTCVSNENGKLTWEVWNRIELQRYKHSVGAHGYCAKYINKKRADYDLLIN